MKTKTSARSKKPTTQKKSSALGKGFDFAKVFRPHPDVVYKSDKQGQVSLVHMYDNGAFYKIDGHAAQLWKLIDGKKPVSKLVEQIQKKSFKAADKDFVETESKKFFQSLLEADLIQEV